MPSKLKGDRSKVKIPYFVFWILPFAFSLVPLTGCSSIPKAEAEAKTQSNKAAGGDMTAVDVAIASTGSLQQSIEYTGITNPVREVRLRSQAEGRLLKLNVDVGNPVKQGQLLAQLNDDLLVTAVNQAQAELAARQSEVARAQAQVSNARTQLEKARVELQQAQIDAARYSKLVQQGAIALQQAQLYQTAARTAQQTVLSAGEQIRTEQQAVVAAQGRVAAQQAIVAQNRERLSYALVPSPITGIVLAKLQEQGNLVSPSDDILRLGDFTSVKIQVKVSDKELSTIRVGQPVQVRLDTFPKESFRGIVSLISPEGQNRIQYLVEVTIPNTDGKIGNGLLARVIFSSTAPQRVVVPQTALPESRESAKAGSPRPEERSNSATLFVVTDEVVVIEDRQYPKVQARSVTVGDRTNGKAEIISGLKPGERYVARSGKPLKDGESVRLSVLSDKQKAQ